MTNNVKIGGVTVDADDPCALYAVLYNAKLSMLAGGNVILVQHGDTRTQFSSSSMTALNKELARLKDLCTQSTGGRKARFAIRAGFRKIP